MIMDIFYLDHFVLSLRLMYKIIVDMDKSSFYVREILDFPLKTFANIMNLLQSLLLVHSHLQENQMETMLK